ncbi:MAG: carnitine dehydratase [Azospirillum brasilense]|nr:MAG: carnitine dehydratase [Azospirillum brasilense]
MSAPAASAVPDDAAETPAGTAPGGPLAGLRVVEFAGLGPGPFACMLLADMGADVLTIMRPGERLPGPGSILGRGRRVIQLDLKSEQDRATVLALCDRADVLVEGFRPGVMERLGLGPEALARRNPRLVYGRITGWGQDGPLAPRAGHDINFIALAGALHAMGPADGPPVPPLNLLGDYAGGSLYLVCGVLAALLERQRSGRGQTVDAAMVDGVLSLMSSILGLARTGRFTETRGTNLLDGGAPFYAVYRTADGGHVSIGALEPAFFDILCDRLELPAALREAQRDRAAWPDLHAAFTRIFAARGRDEWETLLGDVDACFAPVLPLSELEAHPHHRARGAFVTVGESRQPAPAPRFGRTPSGVPAVAPEQPVGREAALAAWDAAPPVSAGNRA